MHGIPGMIAKAPTQECPQNFIFPSSLYEIFRHIHEFIFATHMNEIWKYEYVNGEKLNRVFHSSVNGLYFKI